MKTRVLPFDIVNSFHNYLAASVGDEEITEASLMSLLREYARSRKIDPEVLYDNYLAYALMVRLSKEGLLDEVMDEIEAETALEVASFGHLDVN